MGLLLQGSMVGLMATSSKRAYAPHCVTQVYCTQRPCPCGRPLMTCTFGDTQTLKGRSDTVYMGSLGPGAYKIFFEPFKHLWWVWDLILKAILPLLRFCWAWPHPSKQDPVSSTVSLSHQEASISLLSYSSEGRQNENHNHRKLAKVITWAMAMCNSMKLWTMPCRVTQDVRVFVESSGKCGPLEKGMANHFSILALRTPWTVWKDKKIWHWNMNSPGW